MKKYFSIFLSMLLTISIFVVPVSAENGRIVPEEDPNFVEMSLEDFLEGNPGYVGYEGPEKEAVMPAASDSTYYEWKLENGKYYLYRYQVVSGTLTETKMINYWYQDPSNNKWYYLKPTTGEMAVGWCKVNSYWYYFNAGGIMQVDWYQVSGKWYYLRTAYIANKYGGPEGGAMTGATYLPTTVGSTNCTRNYYFDYNCAMQDWTYPLPTSCVSCSSCFNDPRPDGNHQGLDIPATSGTTVKSCTSGEVIRQGYNYSMGNYVIIESDVKDNNGKYLRLRYQHFQSDATVVVKDTVSAGQTIGHVGTTGQSTGPHLHLDVNDQGLPVDGGSLTINVSSCINPSSFFTTITLQQGALADVPPYGENYCYAR